MCVKTNGYDAVQRRHITEKSISEKLIQQKNMKLPGYHSSGQFARMAGVSLRTIRFYDQQNILKPSYVNPSGARFYTDADFARLQQILLLKYLGFSLDDIREMTISGADDAFILNSLKLQKRLVEDRIEQMQLVAEAIEDTAAELERRSNAAPFYNMEKSQQDNVPDWSRMLRLIHLTGMEKSLKSQYQNATNISARIRLHRAYSLNQEGWFPWLYRMSGLPSLAQKNLSERREQTGSAMGEPLRILELGCGDGALWTENMQRLLKLCEGGQRVEVILSDISEGMLRDARRNIEAALAAASPKAEPDGLRRDSGAVPCPEAAPFAAGNAAASLRASQNLVFRYQAFDCQSIAFPENSFDLIFANHVLFYCRDLQAVCHEVQRVLRSGGQFVCSTYGSAHMHEISELVQAFDKKIVLAAENLYEHFGLENGAAILQPYFPELQTVYYQDAIELDNAQPLIEYILSCHGNQNQVLLDRYKEFRAFVEKKVHGGFHITKDAGAFLAKKKTKEIHENT